MLTVCMVLIQDRQADQARHVDGRLERHEPLLQEQLHRRFPPGLHGSVPRQLRRRGERGHCQTLAATTGERLEILRCKLFL